MKKIICLFLMATTLSLASAPAVDRHHLSEVINSQISFQDNSHDEESLNKEFLVNILGRGSSASGIFGFLCGATMMTAFAFGGPPGIAIGLVLGGVSCGVGLYLDFNN